MRTTRRAVVLAVVFGSIFMANALQAGDIKGKVSVTGLKSAENIAVYIDAIPGKKFDAPAQHVSVDQRDMKFIPQTIVILKGTTVDFLNSDHVAHNVHWSSIGGDKALAHNLVTVSPGQKKVIPVRQCWHGHHPVQFSLRYDRLRRNCSYSILHVDRL